MEFAPYQKVPKPRPNKRKDNRMATIDTDPEYLKFLEAYEKGDEAHHRSVEQHLEEMEAKERERGEHQEDNIPQVLIGSEYPLLANFPPALFCFSCH